MISTFPFNVTATAQKIVPTAPAPDRSGLRYALIITNTSASDIFIGASDVTTAAYTYKVPAGQVCAITADHAAGNLAKEPWHAVAAGAVTINVTEGI